MRRFFLSSSHYAKMIIAKTTKNKMYEIYEISRSKVGRRTRKK